MNTGRFSLCSAGERGRLGVLSSGEGVTMKAGLSPCSEEVLAVFIVEMTTTAGRVCESFPTYEEALRRVELFPPDSLIGMPMIFQELADGSQRLVREDGKPLQWHRLPEDRRCSGPDEPLPLVDESSGLLGEGHWIPLPQATPQETEWDDLPLLEEWEIEGDGQEEQG